MVVLNNPSQVDDIRKIVDTSAEVPGKDLPVLLF